MTLHELYKSLKMKSRKQNSWQIYFFEITKKNMRQNEIPIKICSTRNLIYLFGIYVLSGPDEIQLRQAWRQLS